MSVCVMDRVSRSPTEDTQIQETIKLMVAEAMDRKQDLMEFSIASQVLRDIEYKIDAFKTEIRNEMERKHAYLTVLDHTLEGAVAKLTELGKEREHQATSTPGVNTTANATDSQLPHHSEQTLGHLLSRIIWFFKGKRDLRESSAAFNGTENATETHAILRQGALGKLYELLDPLLDAKFKEIREEMGIDGLTTCGNRPGTPPVSQLSADEELLADKLLTTRFPALKNSKLLTKEYRRFLAVLLHERYHSATLLMNSERDGGTPSVFHRLCDGKGPTLVLVKSGLYVGGGVTDKSWDTRDIPHASSQAFVFSLNNRQVYRPTELGLNKAVRGVLNKGPVFIDALEIAAYYKYPENKSNLGWTYGAWKIDAKHTLFGQSRFAIDVYEVYQLA